MAELDYPNASAPHPVPLPMGEGTLELSLRTIQGSLLQLHPLADAATQRCKLAKASLRGEGQGEGRFAHYWPALRRRVSQVAE
jgi:hypothetical protein